MSWILGSTSKSFESGVGGSGTVSSGKGDYGGVSYGTYQFSSKTGTVSKFISMMGYSGQFHNLIPGTHSFSEKWKEMAKSNPHFGEDQHKFIKLTHYDVQLQYLIHHDIDLSKRGNGVQDMVWSTSVQFGPNTSVILNALRDHDIASLSDTDIVNLVQDYKINNNDILFKSSSLEVKRSTKNRAIHERDALIYLIKHSQ